MLNKEQAQQLLSTFDNEQPSLNKDQAQQMLSQWDEQQPQKAETPSQQVQGQSRHPILNTLTGMVESPVGTALSSAGQSLAQQMFNAAAGIENIRRKKLGQPLIMPTQAVSAPGAKEHPLAALIGQLGGGGIGYGATAGALAPLKIGGAAAPMLAGALYGASQSPENVGKGALEGGALGGVLHGASKGLGKLGKGLLGKLTPKQIEAAKSRLAEAKSIGVPLLPAGALTRDPAIQAREELLGKTAPQGARGIFDLASDKINNDIINSSNNFVKNIKGESTLLTKEDLGEQIQSHLRDKNRNNRDIISSLYDKASNAEGIDTKIPSKDIINTYKNILDEYIDPKFAPRFKKDIEDISTGKKPLTVGKANKMIKALNKTYSTASPSDQLASNELKGSIFDSIDSLADKDSDAAKLFDKARNTRRELGENLQKELPDKIITKKRSGDDKLSPAEIFDKIFVRGKQKGNLKSIGDALNFALDEDGNVIQNPEGENLYNNLLKSKMNDVLDKSTNVVNGKPRLSHAKLLKEYSKLEDSTKNTLFGAHSDKNAHNNFKKLLNVLDYWQNKAPGVINTSNTANVLLNAVNNARSGLLGKIPFAGKFAKTAIDDFRAKQELNKYINFVNELDKSPKIKREKSKIVTPLIMGSLLSNKGKHQ